MGLIWFDKGLIKVWYGFDKGLIKVCMVSWYHNACASSVGSERFKG